MADRVRPSTWGVVSFAPAVYWEKRARRYAHEGAGLKAVCSYGMPAFYNKAIELAQRLALRPWLRDVQGASVLDVGCGVGRWSLRLAERGASVTGVDLSHTMVEEAGRRAGERGLSSRCRFEVADVIDLDLDRRFDRILSVTVLQHIVDPATRRRALARLAAHLAPGGRMVLLEAAPRRACGRADHGMFQAADFDSYRTAAEGLGLRVEAVTGVDAILPRRWALPLFGRVSRPVAHAALALATLVSLPYEIVLARRLPGRSWHRVIVLSHAGA